MRRAVTVLVAAVALAACGSDGGDTAVDDAPIDTDAASAATVTITTSGCGPRTRSGQGAIIDDRLIVTAAHVVAGATAIEVDGLDGSAAAEAVLFDPDLDIAMLRSETSIGPATTLSPTGVDGARPAMVILPSRVDTSDEMSTVDVDVSDPLTIRTTDIYLGRDVERDGFKVDASIEEGDSGSMVHQADGGVGIIWARSNIEADQAWAVAFPETILDPAGRQALVEPVDVGGCS